MRLQLLIAVILGLLKIAQADTVYECVSSGNIPKLSRGDSAVFCVHLDYVDKSDAAYSSSSKIVFKVTTDKYQALSIKGVYNKIKTGGIDDNLSIRTQCMNKESLSDSIYYIQTNATSTKIYQAFSAVVIIDQGVIQKVEWDNGCFKSSAQCDSQNIYEEDGTTVSYVNKNNYKLQSECVTQENSTSSDCDVIIYVSWLGTDSNGNFMVSGNQRMSKFYKYSLNDLYTSSQDAINSI